MSFKKILIPIDGSVYSDAAIAKGIELAKLAGSEITLFFTIDSSIYTHTAAGASLSNLESILKAEKEEVLKNGQQKIADAGLTCAVRYSEGIPEGRSARSPIPTTSSSWEPPEGPVSRR